MATREFDMHGVFIPSRSSQPRSKSRFPERSIVIGHLIKSLRAGRIAGFYILNEALIPRGVGVWAQAQVDWLRRSGGEGDCGRGFREEAGFLHASAGNGGAAALAAFPAGLPVRRQFPVETTGAVQVLVESPQDSPAGSFSACGAGPAGGWMRQSPMWMPPFSTTIAREVTGPSRQPPLRI